MQIIGLGIVGTAQAYLFQQLNIRDVVGYDIKINNHSYCKTNNCIIGDVDITFICTPEDVVEDVIRSLVEIDHKGIIVIRSTVPIGTIKYLSEKFDVHICHNPEFLKEEAYLDDIMNPNMIVIGECCQKHGDMLEELYKPINKPIKYRNVYIWIDEYKTWYEGGWFSCYCWRYEYKATYSRTKNTGSTGSFETLYNLGYKGYDRTLYNVQIYTQDSIGKYTSYTKNIKVAWYINEGGGTTKIQERIDETIKNQ